jgi:hypothetical protein
MKKLFKSVVIGCLCIYSGLKILDIHYTNVIRENPCEKVFWALEKRGLDLDYVFIGSSRTESHIDVRLLNQLSDNKGLNLGSNGGGFAENYLILSHFLKSNLVKEVFLQVDPFSFNPNKSFSYPFHEYLFNPFLTDSITSAVVLDKCGYLKYSFWKSIPFLRYSEFNSEYKFLSIMDDYGKNCEAPFDDFGYRSPSNKSPRAHIIDGVLFDLRYSDSMMKIQRFALEPEALKYFNKINDLTKKNGIKLSVFMAPIYPKWLDIHTEFDRFCIDLDSISAELGIPFENYSNWNSYKPDSLFLDYTHLNSKGVKFFMADIAKIL